MKNFHLPRFIFACFALLAFVSLTAFAGDQKTASIAQQYGALPETQMVSISPNGDMMAFRRTDSEQDLVIVYSLEKDEVITGADVSEILPKQLYFVNDDYLVLVASEVKDLRQFRDEFEMSNAFALDIHSGEITTILRPGRNLQRKHVIYKGQMGLGRIVGSSQDQTHLYMPAYVGEHKRDYSPRYSLLKVKLDSRLRPHIHSRGNRNTRDYFVSPQGDVLAREDYSNERNLHSILVPDGHDMRTIYTEETEIPSLDVKGLTPDLQSLVVLKENPDTGRQSYYVMSLEDGKLSELPFGRDDADIEGVLSGIDRIVHGVTYSGFTPGHRLFDKALDQRVKKVAEQFPGHAVWLASWSAEWEELVFYVEGTASSGHYYLSSPEQPLEGIAAARPAIKAERVHPSIIFEYKARDGLTIPSLLTVPRQHQDNPSNLPTIMMPHGGPESYDRQGFNWLAQAFAEEGYLVIQPQFRGSAGFGRKHWEAGLGEWGRKMQSDLTDGVEFLARNGLTNPDQVCIVGSSYGGYAALAGAAFTPDLYQCAISINGVSDLEMMMDDDRQRYGDDHWVLAYFERSIAKENYSEEHIQRISPANFADAVKAPVLLVHGENDAVVPVEQSETMRDQLEDADKSVQFLELEGENHYLMQGDRRIEATQTVLEFLSQHLSIQPKTDEAKAEQSAENTEA